jgi:hypothetical protein
MSYRSNPLARPRRAFSFQSLMSTASSPFITMSALVRSFIAA